MAKKRRALISVSNRNGLAQFAKGLTRLKFEIVSTGGTAEYLKRNGIKVTSIEKLTGLPPILGGRVKSLHPAIYGGILAQPAVKRDLRELKKIGGEPFDLVVCNLYPFEKSISAKRIRHKEAIENIDIGGPSMVRAAAKNYENVAVIVDPEDYESILAEMRKRGGALSEKTRVRLAYKAFAHTARYDSLIVSYFGALNAGRKTNPTLPNALGLALEKERDLRYGENPHQKGGLYRQIGGEDPAGAPFEQLWGAEISFNNILDMYSAWEIVQAFTEPTSAIVKHNNPCGVAQGKIVSEAFRKAHGADPTSAFGGAVASNRAIDFKTAELIIPHFFELVVAPGFDDAAIKLFKTKKNLRVLRFTRAREENWPRFDFRKVPGGFLVQDADVAELSMSDIKVVSKRQPTVGEIEDLFFAFNVAKFVRSNAVVLVKNRVTVGIGAGQMSRVDSARIALEKAGGKTIGSVMASDGFFPFRDSVDEAGKAGVTAVIEPGGSIRDPEVIEAANEHKMALVFTGRRHFKH